MSGHSQHLQAPGKRSLFGARPVQVKTQVKGKSPAPLCKGYGILLQLCIFAVRWPNPLSVQQRATLPTPQASSQPRPPQPLRKNAPFQTGRSVAAIKRKSSQTASSSGTSTGSCSICLMVAPPLPSCPALARLVLTARASCSAAVFSATWMDEARFSTDTG